MSWMSEQNARAAAWAKEHPAKATIASTVAGCAAYEGSKWGISKVWGWGRSLFGRGETAVEAAVEALAEDAADETIHVVSSRTAEEGASFLAGLFGRLLG